MSKNEVIEDVTSALIKVSDRVMPRILSQICRDENSPNYGCSDRNWWHYKMRDFPSIILQQSGATIHASQCLESYASYSDELNKLTVASCEFWNKRAVRFRSFEEYYPWEEGYPPLAFSTLSIVRMVAEGVVAIEYVAPGLKVASKQLLNRFELQAANQQVAGLAALSWIYKISPDLVSLEEVNTLIDNTLQLQNEEGWFNEYGGPDLGYLSVTIDCLWDAFDATGDYRLIKSAEKALDFIDKMTCNSFGESIGMHNARNTDYIVPYGISRFLDPNVDQNFQKKSLRLLKNIFCNSDCNKHFFSSVDDRYWCHYIGLSVVRSVKVLSEIHIDNSIEFESDKKDVNMYFPSSGYVWKDLNQAQFKVLISMKKGGNFTVFSHFLNCSDFGWVVKSKGECFTSHWWSNDWKTKITNDCCIVSGYLFSHVEIKSNPFNHFLLRISSFFMGRKLISFLKNRLIFKKKKNIINFIRIINFNNNSIVVEDKFDQHPVDCIFIRAPRSSKRHVASADSFHYEDLSLGNCQANEKRVISNNNTIITTTYLLSDWII